MATGASTELGVWEGSRRGSLDDEAAGDLLLKLQEGGAKVVAINRMADPVLRKAAASQQLREKLEARYAPRGQRWKASQQKDWHGSGSWRIAQVRRPHGAQLHDAIAAASISGVLPTCVEVEADLKEEER